MIIITSLSYRKFESRKSAKGFEKSLVIKFHFERFNCARLHFGECRKNLILGDLTLES